MLRHKGWLVLGAWCAMSLSAWSADPAPEDVLKEKGLRIQGDQVALEEETSLPPKITEAGKQRSLLLTARTALVQAQKKAQLVQQRLAQLNNQKSLLEQQLSNVQDDFDGTISERYRVNIQNLDNQILEISTDLEHGATSKLIEGAQEKVTKSHDELAASITALREQVDKLAKQYEELAADPAVQGALEQLKAQGKEYKMVESRPFQRAKAELKKLEGGLAAIDKMDAKGSK